MNKSELTREMAEAVKNTKTAKLLFDSLISTITAALKKKEKVRIAGLGTFKLIKCKARAGINPRTGESIKIMAKNVVKFVPHKRLKDIIQ